MRSRRLLRACVLFLIVSLLALSKPISLDHDLPVLVPPGGGVPVGLAQEGEEDIVIFMGDALGGSPGVVEGTELLEKRTLKSKTYQIGPDEYKAILSTAPMHYRDEEGNWQDIDTTLQHQDDGSYYAGANLVRARFPRQLGAGRIEIEIPRSQCSGSSSSCTKLIPPTDSRAAAGSNDVSLSWQPIQLAVSTGDGLGAQQLSSAGVAQASASASGNSVVYESVFPGVAEEYRVVPGGIKHSLILSSLPDLVPESLSPDAFLDYEVVISLPPGVSPYVDGVEQQADFSTASTIELRRGKKEIVSYLLAPHAYERDNPKEAIACTHLVHLEPGQMIVTVRTPLNWLAASERAFPVVIDPTTSAYMWQDTFMSETYYTSSYYAWAWAFAGYDPPERYNFGRERALFQWSLDPIPYNSTITDAWIALYQDEAEGTVSPCYLELFRMLTPWYSAETTWNQRYFGAPWNSPGAGGVGTDFATPGFGYFFDTTNGWKYLTDVESWVAGWMDGSYPNYGVVLRNLDPYADCDRGFRTMNYAAGPSYDPYLEVTYLFTGGAPTTLVNNSPQTHSFPNPEDYYVEDSATSIYCGSSYTNCWRGTAMRPLDQSDFDLLLHTQSDFSEWRVSSQQGVGRVDYTLTKEMVSTRGYPRVVRFYGSDNYNIQYLLPLGGLVPPYSGGWQMGSEALWAVYEIYLSSPGSWQVVVTPLAGDPDLGVAVHDPTTGDYHTRNSALAISDQVGQNLTEQIEFTASSAGFYGLVVWSNVRTGVTQQFLLEVKAPGIKTYLPSILKNYVPPQGPFSNGGFENSSRWILSGELEHERTTAKRRSGSYSLRLGHDGEGPCLGNVPCSPSGSEDCQSVATATQGFDVPATAQTLKLYYQIYTYDHKPTGDRAADYFAVYIRDLGTSEKKLVYKDDLGWVNDYECYNRSQKSSWQAVSGIDLSPYRGKTVELILEVTNGGHNFWNTWVYVDDVICSGC